MVRVFGCHSFKGSTVVSLGDEPLVVCAESSWVFVATRQCAIQVFKRREDDSQDCPFVEWRSINTICMVEKMAYNKQKDYIITLEQKKTWKSVSRYIRLYLHWQLEPQQRGTKLRTKVRIAGKAHSLHSSKDYSAPQLEVVELPLEGMVTALDVCQATGNFAVAFGREVKLFRVLEKTVANNSTRTYQDVEPFLELCWNLPEVVSLSLSADHLVCCSRDQVQAVRIVYAEDDEMPGRVRSSTPLSLERSGNSRTTSPRQAQETPGQHLMFSLDGNDSCESPVVEVRGHHMTSSPAVSVDHAAAPSVGTQSSFTFRVGAPRPVVDDEHYEEWSFEPDDNNIVYQGGEATNAPPSKVLYLSSLHQGSPHPRRGAAPPVLRDVRGGPVKSSSGVSAKTVLHLSDLAEHDDWLSVTLIPAYLPEPSLLSQSGSVWSSSNPVFSPLLHQRCSLCCYVSSRRGGYLYRISPGVSLISTYRYTDLAYKVEAGPHLLQVVTKTGLETYTARWGAVALAVTETSEGEEEVRPSSSLDICLCGIEPFFGATDISHGSDIIALLTKIEAHKGQEELQWNLYVLENCPVTELYKDMVNFGSRIQETGPTSYQHLLQEAHLLLRWELQRLLTSDSDMHDLYLESCALLGDFYSWPRQDDWHLCLPYYKKSGMSVSDIIRQAIQHRQHSKEQTSVYVYGRGLMQYLDWALFDPAVTLTLKEEQSNEVLQIYTQTSPDSLSSLILLSSLQGYNPDLALQLLSDLATLKESRGEESSTFDRLARVQVQLLLCDPGSAEMELSSLDKGELLEICTKHPQLIHREASGFTPLGQLMRCHTPAILLELLADIVGQGDMTLDTCLLLLEKHCEVSRCKNNQIREFLEVLLSDVKRKLWFEEAAVLLCEIYVQRLLLGIESQPPKQKRSALPKFHMPSGKGHFAVRFSWLDHMPPVASPASLSAPCQRMARVAPGVFGQRANTSPSTPIQAGGSAIAGGGVQGEEREREEGSSLACTCAFCLQDLLKLQAILCSKHTSTDLRGDVLRVMEGGEGGMVGRDSLWMLCSHAEHAAQVTELAVDRYPHIVGRVAATLYGTDLPKWQMVLRCLGSRLKQQTAPCVTADGDDDDDDDKDKKDDGDDGGKASTADSLHQPLLSAYRDVLRELVEVVSAEDFLTSLPPDGSLWFMLPFLSRCLQRRHLEELKDTVMTKGRALLAQLNETS